MNKRFVVSITIMLLFMLTSLYITQICNAILIFLLAGAIMGTPLVLPDSIMFSLTIMGLVLFASWSLRKFLVVTKQTKKLPHRRAATRA